MTTPTTEQVGKKEGVTKEALKNAEEETKHAMLMIQTTTGISGEQVTAELRKKFPHLTPETAGRIYEEAGRQLVLEKDRRNATKLFLQEKASGNWPDAYQLQRMFPRLLRTWQEAKEFQEELMKKYGENNHKLPKATEIPPVAKPTPVPPPASVLSNSKTQVPQNMNGSKSQTPQNITASSTTQAVKPEASRPEIVPRGTKRNQVIADIAEPVRSPLWRNFNVYADDPRAEEILLENVVTQTFSPRQHIDDDYIRSLGESLRDEGQERAILVTPREGKLLSVSGDCRIEAARKVGLTKLRGLVVHLTDEQAIALGLAANLEHDLPHRPLTAIEEAKVLKKLTEDPYNWTQERAAEFFGRKAHTWVIKRLDLLKASGPIQEKVQEGKLTERHVRSLTGLPEGAQEKVADKVVAEGLSTRQTQQLVNGIKSHPTPETVTPKEMDAILAGKREEILPENEKQVTECPEKSKAEIIAEIGAVPLHKDNKGIYFFVFKCKACGSDHSANINIEQGVAIIKGPQYLKEKGAA